ncbi:UbiH/UbiF family hydroxylase [Polycladidibacter hongkongensis]|uniref:UbiH/UbiF family hydroxylase n=1 Tax=Polycladidibacter hongkongensis TaxID=1647556 RepID=UPI00082E6604|nr:UbiH/UbiF family hydroxylase [Pseudovibrio hongkongensis]
MTTPNSATAPNTQQHYQIAVVGAGPAGMIAALAFASQGFEVALIGPPANLADERSTALMQASIQLLENIDVWPELEAEAIPLVNMRLIDGSDRLFRAPEITFGAAEVGLPAFGYNILNSRLNELLDGLINKSSKITRIEGLLHTMQSDDAAAHLRIKTASGLTALSCPLVIAADGRRSQVREAVGISTRSWSYPQTALVLNLAHTGSHASTSTEFHRKTGPFTLVPMEGDASSLVYVETPERAKQLTALPTEELALELERTCQSVLGKFTVISKLQSFPMSGHSAQKLASSRALLIGEAAHGFPPIGAQGLNLSLRDIGAAMELAQSARQEQQDLGSREIMQVYHKMRWFDMTSRTVAVDLLNRSLLSSAIPVQLLRSIGLMALSRLPFLRKILMREGIAPSWRTPPTMSKRR